MRLAACWVVFSVAGLVYASEEARVRPTAGDTRREFGEICSRSREGRDPFVGQAIVGELMPILSALEPESRETFDRFFDVGVHLIRLGRHQEALRLPEQAPAGHPLADGYLLLRAAAHLQLAFDRNCLADPKAGSCILPIRRSAQHHWKDHSRAANELYGRYLEKHPRDTHVGWLLNISGMLSGDYPDKVPAERRLTLEATAPDGGVPLWINVAPRLGVNAVDLAGGAIMDDFDGDGLLDLVSSSRDPCEPLKAFRNNGRGSFDNASEDWGLTAQLGGLNLVHADYDGDGMLDLLVLRGAWLGEGGRIRNSLLRNDLKGSSRSFVDVTSAARLAYPAYPTQTAAWADFDVDGDLDLYVGNESGQQTLMKPGQTTDAYPSQLFRNNGDGTFTDVAWSAGVQNLRFAKAVAWGDYDNDGDPDLYVSNFGPNRLYRNNGDGTFVDVALQVGVDTPAGPSFATWFFDYDNDGDLDIFVADYSASVAEITASYSGVLSATGRPIIHRNDGGRFTALSGELGLERPLLPMGANFGDLDNDGWLDFYLGTGHPDVDALMPNVMYRNMEGRGFTDISLAGGFAHLQKGHGVAFGDLDNDGDQDLFHQLGGAYPFDSFGNALYENPTGRRSWIVLRMEGGGLNRMAVGARVRVQASGPGGPLTIRRVVGGGGSFGGSSLQVEAGLGGSEQVDLVAIRWPTGGPEQVFEGPFEINRFYAAVEGVPHLEVLSLPELELGRPDAQGGGV